MPTVLAPSCDRLASTRFSLEGPLAAYCQGVTRQWLLVAPDANPGMLEMLRDRDRQPRRALAPWAGEFAGKYLTGAVQMLRVTGDPALRRYLADFVAELVSLQAEDGYLGPWPRADRLTNGTDIGEEHIETWDTWGHYHIMCGLLMWHAESGDAAALSGARRIGDLLCARYLGTPARRLVETGTTEINLSPAHSLCLLYRHTSDPRHLALARQIVDVEFAAKAPDGAYLSGNWLQGALDGQEFFALPKPRWESLHSIMALAELYYLTGETHYRMAFQHIWRSIARLDRHNNGGFSSGEQAQGDPFHLGAIETCCTIAWTALTVEMLRLTADPLVADELELTLWNSITGMHSATGRWATYNTPMDGVRLASAHQIVFQSREGTPELNCCSVNSARGFGMLSDWAVTRAGEALLLNFYGPGTLTTACPDGTAVTLTQQTDYPRDGRITLTVTPDAPVAFTLKLRIPRWSTATSVSVNGEPVAAVTPGSYLALSRTWTPGDRVEIALDFSWHAWQGGNVLAGLTSLYRGPLLLTYDRRFNTLDPADLPALDAHALAGTVVSRPYRLPPMLLMDFPTSDGQTLTLCDFGSAGEGGSPYQSWLPVKHVEELPEYFG